MKKTPFYEMHKKYGAKIVEFAGFQMPIQYEGIIAEHKKVRESVGMFDVTHMGEIEIRGKNALDFIQKITINDASKLNYGRIQYSAMCYPDCGIVDDLLVYRFEDHYMLVVNASNKDKDYKWILDNKFGEVEIIDKSDDFSLLAIQGRNSLKTLQKLTDVNLSEIKYYHFVEGELGGEKMVISRTGYTGELGFELYFKSDISLSEKLWEMIIDAGKEFAISPIGLGARDTLRLEMGMCLYGNDIDNTTNPLESGLGWITKLDKEDFICKANLIKIKNEGLKRKLVGFTLQNDDNSKVIPRHNYEIFSNDKKIGHVTSGMYSPILNYSLGMGYVEKQFESEGTKVEISIRNKMAQARVVKPPFVQIKH
jgi:aminomethyltransferase